MRPAFALLGRLHAAGLIRTDLHLGNFLEHQGALLIIDGDGIRPVAKGRTALARQTALMQQQLSRDGATPAALAGFRKAILATLQALDE